MKFKLVLDADKLMDALSAAEGDGAESLSLVIMGTVDKKDKAIITKAYLQGECVTEYNANVDVI